MAGYVEVARSSDAVYARVTGLGNFNNAGPFREYCEAAFDDGLRCVIVDLSECTGLDSTFMGTLVGFVTFDSSDYEDTRPIAVTVVNATPVAQRAMASLGLPAMLYVKAEHVSCPETRLTRLREGWMDQKRRTKLVLDAHEHLARMDSANAERFGPFIEKLAKEAHQHCNTRNPGG